MAAGSQPLQLLTGAHQQKTEISTAEFKDGMVMSYSIIIHFLFLLLTAGMLCNDVMSLHFVLMCYFFSFFFFKITFES